VEDASGKPLAVLVNYTCHPTTLDHRNREVTADYPGLVCRRLEEETGVIALFLMGAIGDVGPVARGEESLATVGNAVADAALAALPHLTPMENVEIETMGEMVALPLLPLPSRDDWLAWRAGYEAAALAAEHDVDTLQISDLQHINDPARAKVQWAMVHWTERLFEEMQDDQLTPTVEAEVQVLRIGDLALAGVPGEYFVELGLQIKEGIRQRGVRQVMVVGFANGNVGYIPARRAYPKGGYEVAEAYKYYGYPAAIAPEGGEKIVACAVRLGCG
jgi:neutral ceramidase